METAKPSVPSVSTDVGSGVEKSKSGKAMNDLVGVARLTKDGCTYQCKRLHDSLF